MEGTKTFTRSKGNIINAIFDIIELQNGELILSDTRRGKVHFQLTMYGYVWQLLYSISETGNNKCEVSTSIFGERQDTKREIRRQFALLDTMLEGGADVKFSDTA